MKGKKRGIQKKLMVSILPIVAISFLVLTFCSLQCGENEYTGKDAESFGSRG